MLLVQAVIYPETHLRIHKDSGFHEQLHYQGSPGVDGSHPKNLHWTSRLRSLKTQVLILSSTKLSKDCALLCHFQISHRSSCCGCSSHSEEDTKWISRIRVSLQLSLDSSGTEVKCQDNSEHRLQPSTQGGQKIISLERPYFKIKNLKGLSDRVLWVGPQSHRKRKPIVLKLAGSALSWHCDLGELLCFYNVK